MSEAGFASLPLDPGRAVSWINTEVDGAAERDPSIRKAKALLEERMRELDDAEIATFTSTLWLWFREYLLHGYPLTAWPPFCIFTGTPPGLLAVRVGLADGDTVLRGIEQSLDTNLSGDVLKRVAREGREVANADLRKTDLLNVAQMELRGGADTDVSGHAAGVFLAGVAVGLIIGYAAAETLHGPSHR